MNGVVVVASGQIAFTIARLLADAGDYDVTIVDRSAEQLTEIESESALSTAHVDIPDEAALSAQLFAKFAVLSAAPFHLRVAIARALARPHRGC